MSRVSRILASFVIGLVALSASAVHATAQIYSGQATGIKSTIFTGVVPGVTTAVTDTGPLPSAGGSITLASASANVAGVLTAGASTVSTSGIGNSSQSTASVAQLDVNVSGLDNELRVRADAIAATTSCTCPTAGCTGTTTITNLRVGTRGGGTQIVVTGAANQTVVTTIGAVTLTIVINERIISPSSITVNALHITLSNSITGVITDVIVASAHSDIRCSTPPLFDKFSGRATGVRLAVRTLIPQSQVATIVSDTGFLPTTGGSIAVTTAGTNIPGILSTGVVTSSTSGMDDTSQSNSTVNNLNVSLIGAVTIGATILESNTQCTCAMTPPVSCSGNSVVTNLAVTIAGEPLAITISGMPNQVVTLPLGLGTIIINEQTSAGPGDITVNALHVLLTPLGLASTDLVIAHAHSDIVCFIAPTAGGAMVSGRIVDSNDRPIYGAVVRLIDQTGEVRSGRSNSLGFYSIDDVPVAEIYYADVSHKQFSFAPRTVTVHDNVADLDFVADP